MITLKEEIINNFTDIAESFWARYESTQIRSVRADLYRNYMYTMDLVNRIKKANIVEDTSNG